MECDRLNYERNIGKHSIRNRNEGGQRMLDFAQVNNLNTFFQHRESYKWTWYRYGQQRRNYIQSSMIDLFITSYKALFCDVQAIPSVSMDTGHRLFSTKLRIRKPKEQEARELDDTSWAYLRIGTQLQTCNSACRENFRTLVRKYKLENFEGCAVNSASEVLGEKKPHRQGLLQSGLGSFVCGLGNLKVWSTFSVSHVSYFAEVPLCLGTYMLYVSFKNSAINF